VRFLSIDQLFVTFVVSKRQRWETFRTDHPALFRWLYRVYRAYGQLRVLQYHRLYSRFSSFTMIPRRGYVTNLFLCEQFRHVPGSIIECGTWRGGMIAGIAQMFNDDRNYYLFDSFEGLPAAQDVDTRKHGSSAKELQKTSYHNCRAEEDVARRAMELSGARHVHIRKGWFKDTLPRYDGPPIAILRADGDWYESTMDILNNLYPHVVKGGLIILDDYYYWDGCAKAVHDFLSKNALKDKIYQINGLYAYIVKQ
jgi:O-methyltransferase